MNLRFDPCTSRDFPRCALQEFFSRLPRIVNFFPCVPCAGCFSLGPPPFQTKPFSVRSYFFTLPAGVPLELSIDSPPKRQSGSPWLATPPPPKIRPQNREIFRRFFLHTPSVSIAPPPSLLPLLLPFVKKADIPFCRLTPYLFLLLLRDVRCATTLFCLVPLFAAGIRSSNSAISNYRPPQQAPCPL